MSDNQKAVVTCALTGVLTNPAQHPVPVTAEEMAQSAREAFDAGASVMHVHFRRQEPGMGHLPSWEPDVAEVIIEGIRKACPGVIINMSTGVFGLDVSDPVSCMERVRPEISACNAGSLNYLKTRRSGGWAWPPLLFDNAVSKIEKFIKVMYEEGVAPECECFDTGIVRSIAMFDKVALLRSDLNHVGEGTAREAEFDGAIVLEDVEGEFVFSFETDGSMTARTCPSISAAMASASPSESQPLLARKARCLASGSRVCFHTSVIDSSRYLDGSSEVE